MNWLAKRLFPNHYRDLRRKKMRGLMMIVMLMLLITAAFGVALYFMSKGRS